MVDCSNGHRPTMPLALVGPGESVDVITIAGGREVRRRLAALGLTDGMTVRVMRGGPTGPMILAVKNDTRVAVGRGVAHKILVALPTSKIERQERER